MQNVLKSCINLYSHSRLVTTTPETNTYIFKNTNFPDFILCRVMDQTRWHNILLKSPQIVHSHRLFYNYNICMWDLMTKYYNIIRRYYECEMIFVSSIYTSFLMLLHGDNLIFSSDIFRSWYCLITVCFHFRRISRT